MRSGLLLVPALAVLLASCGSPDLKVAQETAAQVDAASSRCDPLESPAQSDTCNAKTMAGQRRPNPTPL